jgi:hypothetical protein
MFQEATLFTEERWHEAGNVDLNVDDLSLQLQGVGVGGRGGGEGVFRSSSWLDVSGGDIVCRRRMA